jgi:hypothetical protein
MRRGTVEDLLRGKIREGLKESGILEGNGQGTHAYGSETPAFIGS